MKNLLNDQVPDNDIVMCKLCVNISTLINTFFTLKKEKQLKNEFERSSTEKIK
jgi:hypothetical protein